MPDLSSVRTALAFRRCRRHHHLANLAVHLHWILDRLVAGTASGTSCANEVVPPSRSHSLGNSGASGASICTWLHGARGTPSRCFLRGIVYSDQLSRCGVIAKCCSLLIRRRWCGATPVAYRYEFHAVSHPSFRRCARRDQAPHLLQKRYAPTSFLYPWRKPEAAPSTSRKPEAYFRSVCRRFRPAIPNSFRLYRFCRISETFDLTVRSRIDKSVTAFVITTGRITGIRAHVSVSLEYSPD